MFFCRRIVYYSFYLLLNFGQILSDWLCVHHPVVPRNHRDTEKSMSVLESPASSRADSLSYLYESGFARRLQ